MARFTTESRKSEGRLRPVAQCHIRGILLWFKTGAGSFLVVGVGPFLAPLSQIRSSLRPQIPNAPPESTKFRESWKTLGNRACTHRSKHPSFSLGLRATGYPGCPYPERIYSEGVGSSLNVTGPYSHGNFFPPLDRIVPMPKRLDHEPQFVERLGFFRLLVIEAPARPLWPFIKVFRNRES